MRKLLLLALMMVGISASAQIQSKYDEFEDKTTTYIGLGKDVSFTIVDEGDDRRIYLSLDVYTFSSPIYKGKVYVKLLGGEILEFYERDAYTDIDCSYSCIWESSTFIPIDEETALDIAKYGIEKYKFGHAERTVQGSSMQKKTNKNLALLFDFLTNEEN